MVKVILLTVWCSVGIMTHLSNHGELGKYTIYGKLINTIIWLGFVYWFAI